MCCVTRDSALYVKPEMVLLGKSRDLRLMILEISVEYETNQDLTKLLIKLHFKQYLIKDREVSRVGVYLG